ncbi:MAG: hypothetical protein Q8912_05175 [Bacillota bacterium]|nr:hypothetical protein [Bacillota bacterium]
MKVKKKTVMLISFTLGTLLLATTALADIATKSGYDQLKDALKVTAEQSSEKFDSFTMDLSIAMKDNGKTLMTENEIRKYNRSMSATESLSSGEDLTRGKHNSQVYLDKTTMIRVSDSDPTYYVTEFTKERKEETFSNPFKENRAEDIEKIADAVVGSLKDHVVVTENPDGSKGLAGSLTEVQIPSLVNAVASFQMKQEFDGRQDNLPHLTKDVFVKEVKGTAKVNKDGVLESILGTAQLSGIDDQGTVHEVTIEVLGKLSGINSTTVTKPDLSGKTVIKNIANSDNSSSEITSPEKFVGKFKNDILIEKNNKFVKVGERFIEISQIDNETVTGRYYEVFKPGYEEYTTPNRDFAIKAKRANEKNSSDYEYTTSSGIKGNLFFDQYAGKIFLNGRTPSLGSLIFDSTFNPDVE